MADSNDYRQMDMYYIPGWNDAPEWANWVQFCTLRGWVFTDKPPHVYSDGVSSVHGVKFIEAIKTPGIVFLRNHKHYSGRSRPWPE